MSSRPASVVVIGAGPRAVGWLERFAARRADAGPCAPVTVHLVDPFPPGGGRIWRYRQSPLLKLNSMAGDVTMFTDDSCEIEGPVVSGPSLIEWAQQVRTGAIEDVVIDDPLVGAEVRGLTAVSFPTRRLQSSYLDWFARHAMASLDGEAAVRVHADRVLSVEDVGSSGDGDNDGDDNGDDNDGDDNDGSGEGTQLVRLAGGSAIEADLVLYALGHNGCAPDGRSAALTAFASRHGLTYLPPQFTADADTEPLRAGETVAVRGFGLAAIDLIVLLTEGRGGRFDRGGDGILRYTPSGLEPRLLIGSRRGVPYHSKISSVLVGVRPPLRFFTGEIAAELAARSGPVDFASEVWPLIAKEMLHGYYAELFTGHPERTSAGWDAFLEAFTPLDPFGAEVHVLVERTIPDPEDRLDLAGFDRPLDGEWYADAAGLQDRIRSYLRRDLRLRTLPEHSATLGLFTSLLLSMFALAGVQDAVNWSARSRVEELQERWQGYFSYVASGPPAHRLEELIALSEAGVVEFAGSGMRVEADEELGMFRVSGANVDREVVVGALVDAWLPASRAAASDNAALRSLIESGAGAELLVSEPGYQASTGRLRVRPGDARVLDAAGVPHPRRYAIGPFTTAPLAGAFARPGTDAISFRENDAVAGAMLRRLAELPNARADRGIDWRLASPHWRPRWEES